MKTAKIAVVAVLFLWISLVIHETGHLVAARSLGVGVLEYSINVGPSIFSICGPETDYRFRMFPLMGYVTLATEELSDNFPSAEFEEMLNERPERAHMIQDREQWLSSKGLLPRVAIHASGVISGLTFGLMCLAILLRLRYSQYRMSDAIKMSLVIAVDEVYHAAQLVWWSLRTAFFQEANRLSEPKRSDRVKRFYDGQGRLFQFLSSLALLNISYSVLNLLPIVPLDGSRIFLAVVETSFGILNPVARWAFDRFGTLTVSFVITASLVSCYDYFRSGKVK